MAGVRERRLLPAPYVSPFYSPCLAENCEKMQGGPNWDLFGDWWGLSPALIILIFPLGFRLTCYYYRKAYYRGFWASPPACAVAEPHKKYTGETRFPLILQNIHRYFFYAAVLVAASSPRTRCSPSVTSTTSGATWASAPWSSSSTSC